MRSQPRMRSSDEIAKVQQHKSHRGSTQVSSNTSIMEYAVPKKKVLQSDSDRWIKLSAKVKPFVAGLEQYLDSLFSPAIACECASLTYSATYETLMLSLPKEVLNLAKHKIKAGVSVNFKLQAQEKLSAFEVLERCRVIFGWIQGEKSNLETFVKQKGTVDLNHVVQLQFFYKYYLRLLNHWNFAHSNEGGGIPVALQRNFLLTINDKAVGGFLGIVINEMDFLRVHLRSIDPTMTLSPRPVSVDGAAENPSGAEERLSTSMDSSSPALKPRTLSGWNIGEK